MLGQGNAAGICFLGFLHGSQTDFYALSALRVECFDWFV